MGYYSKKGFKLQYKGFDSSAAKEKSVAAIKTDTGFNVSFGDFFRESWGHRASPSQTAQLAKSGYVRMEVLASGHLGGLEDRALIAIYKLSLRYSPFKDYFNLRCKEPNK